MKFFKTVKELPIDGLCFDELPVMNNGGSSCVLPIPTTRPIHIVFHGILPFKHGHYGLHKGLADRLIFLGNSKKIITGFFIDCRSESPTFGVRHIEKFAPSIKKMLRIPPGVGHAFEGLEEVFTINAYEAFLPPPETLLTEKNPWATGADILNFKFETPTDELPVVIPNSYSASDTFYEALRLYQKATLNKVNHDYPHTEDIFFEDGSSAKLSVRKPIDRSHWPQDWEPIGDIPGLGWKRHFIVMGDDDTGYSALLDPAPIQIIDHGIETYTHDAYGIHLESEDRLTFVGDQGKTVKAHFIDCRKNSPTFHKEYSISFTPSALKFLVIPPGVAHAFESIETVFTINRPRRCAGDLSKMEPGNDIIDWPIASRPAPVIEVDNNYEDAPIEYYHQLAARQSRYLAENELTSSALTVLIENSQGSHVRLLLRKSKDYSQ